MEKGKVLESLALVAEAEHILITAHRSPDGDAIGSSLAMMGLLRKLGKEKVTVMMPNSYPAFLKWMEGNDEIVVFEDDVDAARLIIMDADLVFSLDYNTLNRTGDMAEVLAQSDARFILIDHHQQPGDFAQIAFSDTSSCSTAQMVMEWAVLGGHENLIDNNIAQAIYCGIMTDSGSFRFPSVTAETHRMVARLIERGLDHSEVHMKVYDTNQLNRLKLVGHALSNKLDVIESCHTAIIALSKSELDQHQYRSGDTEGLVNYALSLEGINFAVFIREGNNHIRMSFRSKGSFDVNQFARTHFNGGGHVNAAGGISNDTLEKAIEEFKGILPDYQSQLNY